MPNLKLIKTDTLVEYSKAQADKLVKAFGTIDMKALETSADNGTFKVIMTSDKKDRDGEVIKLDAWSFENFMKNPILLYGHNYWGLENVIGRVDKIYQDGNTIVAEGTFASEAANPKAQQVRRLYDEKILQAVSVGFIVKGRDVADDSIITKAELLELSFVPIQSNPDAVSILKSMEALATHKETPDPEESKDEDDTKSLLVALTKSVDGLAESIKSGFAGLQEKKTTDTEEKVHEAREAMQAATRGLSEALRNLKPLKQ